MVNIEKELKKYRVVDEFDTIYHSYDDREKAQKLRKALANYHGCNFFIVEVQPSQKL